jgi:hypothetical protein
MARVTIVIEDGTVVTEHTERSDDGSYDQFCKRTMDKMDDWMGLDSMRYFNVCRSIPGLYRCNLFHGITEIGHGEGATPTCAIAVAMKEHFVSGRTSHHG